MKKRYETIFLEILVIKNDVARCSNMDVDNIREDVYSIGDKVEEDKF